MTTESSPGLVQPGPLEWTDSLLLGYPPLDEVHREFVECLNALHAASDADLPERLEAFARHARSHFAQEDRWMTETVFPPRECHMDEHAAVLASLGEVQQQVAAGHCAEARRLAGALSDWFPKHTAHLDSALSHWMSKIRWNAKPLVFRRNLG
ncbi:MAG TPA: hemerythrin domain-containing protein [Variovorax sp.]